MYVIITSSSLISMKGGTGRRGRRVERALKGRRWRNGEIPMLGKGLPYLSLLEKVLFREGAARAALQVSFKSLSWRLFGKCRVEDQSPGHDLFV